MKKILCLALALMMALTAGLALAGPSITNADTETVEVVDENGNPVTGVTVTITNTEHPGVNDLLAQMAAAAAAGNNPVEALPAAAQAVIPEGSNFNQVNEVVGLNVSGTIQEGGKIYVVLDLQTDYTGKTIGVLLSKVVDGNPVDFMYVEADVIDGGKVRFELTQEIIDWLGGHEMVCMILSK